MSGLRILIQALEAFGPLKIFAKEKNYKLLDYHEASYSAKRDSRHDFLGSRQDEDRASNAVKLIRVVSREVFSVC